VIETAKWKARVARRPIGVPAELAIMLQWSSRAYAVTKNVHPVLTCPTKWQNFIMLPPSVHIAATGGLHGSAANPIEHTSGGK
jgi:hypothetical protein